MNRSQILSGLRIELRRKLADYNTEKTACLWAQKFLDDLSLNHSNQLAGWQIDYFISSMKRSNYYSNEEILQAKSSLLFLFDRVLGRQFFSANGSAAGNPDTDAGIFKVPA
jgi:hypothetical protein